MRRRMENRLIFLYHSKSLSEKEGRRKVCALANGCASTSMKRGYIGKSVYLDVRCDVEMLASKVQILHCREKLLSRQ